MTFFKERNLAMRYLKKKRKGRVFLKTSNLSNEAQNIFLAVALLRKRLANSFRDLR